MKTHIVKVHEKQKPFDFEICEYKCCVKSSMMMHISSVHDKIKPFKCEKCDKSFPKRTPLERHIISVHEKRVLLNVRFVTTAVLKKVL